MERIAIIDHDEHVLYIDDIDEDYLQEEYDGEEEAYIVDTFSLSENWSWEFITKATYYPQPKHDGDETTQVDVDFDYLYYKMKAEDELRPEK